MRRPANAWAFRGVRSGVGANGGPLGTFPWRTSQDGGVSPFFPPLDYALVKAIACERVAETKQPLSRQSLADIAARSRQALDKPLSRSTVWRILATDALKPWRYKYWIFPRDPHFAEKAGPMLDLYAGMWQGQPLGPRDYILSADEKTSIQARIRCHVALPPAPGRPAYIENEYARGGALQYLAAWDVRRGYVMGRCEPTTGIAPFGRLVQQVLAKGGDSATPSVTPSVAANSHSMNHGGREKGPLNFLSTPDRVSQLHAQSAQSSSGVHPFLELQRNIGNQAVQRLINSPYIQTKLAEEALRRIESALIAAHAHQQAEYDKLQEQNLAASDAIRERTAAEQAVAKLSALENRRVEAKEELQRLSEARAILKANYLLEREKISQLREGVATELQREAGSKVRVRVLRNADSLSYQQLLTEGLHGARVRNHEDILAGLLRLRPEQLAQIVQENDLEEFEEQLSLGKERCRRILDAFRENIDPLTLEVVGIEDRICIELNVSPGAEPNFKDAADFSRGQKCTALLPLLLARRDTPLVIDQPEDNLDRSIYRSL